MSYEIGNLKIIIVAKIVSLYWNCIEVKECLSLNLYHQSFRSIPLFAYFKYLKKKKSKRVGSNKASDFFYYNGEN